MKRILIQKNGIKHLFQKQYYCPPIAFALTFLKINTDKSIIDLLGFVAVGCLLVLVVSFWIIFYLEVSKGEIHSY